MTTRHLPGASLGPDRLSMPEGGGPRYEGGSSASHAMMDYRDGAGCRSGSAGPARCAPLAGLTMTEREARESAAAGLREDGSRRAFHLTTRDRFPPSSGSPADPLRMIGRDRLVTGLDRAAARRVTIIS